MQFQQRPTANTAQRRRSRRGLQTDFTPSAIVTAISIGAVVLIVAATFISDWMRTPDVSLFGTGQALSPNNDGAYDFFTVNYRLGDDARVSARVYSGSNNLVRVLAEDEQQTAGEHFLTWDGRTQQGSAAEDGIYRIEIEAGGAMRSAKKSVTAQVDTQPPVIQIANLPDGMQVNKENITLEGITEPGAIVTLVGVSQPQRVDNSGRFSFPYKLLDGDNLIEIQASDTAGNVARVQRSVGLVTEPPDIELARPANNEWTNQQMVTIEGRTRPGATLTINQQTVRVQPDGSFQHQMILDEGDTVLRMTATDSVGNIATLERVVHVKLGAANIQMNVEDGATVADSVLQLNGHVEPGSQLTINGQSVPVSALGDFQYALPLNQGENYLQIESMDQAGNVTRLTRRVIYDGAGADGFSRLNRNLGNLSPFILPSILVTAAILAFIYFQQNRVKLALAVDQPIFAPGGFLDERTLAISLDLSKTARVSLEVYDQQGNPRVTLLYNRRKRGRRHLFYWNGYDDRGQLLPPGDYTLQAEAGAPPLQVSSAVQVRIERYAAQPVQPAVYVRNSAAQK
ncbi:MAG: hypothetical protein Fur002_12880 [Anaerolineales bacterium]